MDPEWSPNASSIPDLDNSDDLWGFLSVLVRSVARFLPFKDRTTQSAPVVDCQTIALLGHTPVWRSSGGKRDLPPPRVLLNRRGASSSLGRPVPLPPRAWYPNDPSPSLPHGVTIKVASRQGTTLRSNLRSGTKSESGSSSCCCSFCWFHGTHEHNNIILNFLHASAAGAVLMGAVQSCFHYRKKKSSSTKVP